MVAGIGHAYAEAAACGAQQIGRCVRTRSVPPVSCGHRRARAGTDKAEVGFEFDKRRTVFELAAVVAKHSDLTVGSFRL